MEASGQSDGETSYVRRLEGHAKGLLPVVAIYGANASGKSNILESFAYMRQAVVSSLRFWEPDEGVPRSPFAWNSKSKEPSLFEVTFVGKGVKYNYGFVVDDDCVQEEWLSAWPIGRKQNWFHRQRMAFKFGDNLGGPNDAAEEITRENSLFLSAAGQLGHPQLSSIYGWFRSMRTSRVRVRAGSQLFGRGVISLLKGQLRSNMLFSEDESANDKALSRIRELLQSADIGVCDIRQKKVTLESDGEKYIQQQLQLQHKHDDNQSWLNIDEESQGTQTLLDLAPTLFSVLDTGGVLLIDELESSLHPLLGQAIVRLFNSKKDNPNDAQLIFTTHDTNLLGTIVGETALRRDQVWFVEKDKDGGSNLYPLTDYKPRNSENLERGYLQGRYGAIPLLGNLDWQRKSMASNCNG